MEKRAVEKEFHSLLDDVVDRVRDKLDISKAVRRRTSSETAASIVSESSTVQNEIIDPEIESYRNNLKKQFTELLEAVENEETVEERADKLLEHDIFYQNLEQDSSEVRKKVIERLEALHTRLDRIKDSEREDVWQAVHKEFTEDEAEEFIDEMFGFLDELEKHRQKMSYTKEIDLSQISMILPFNVEVDYTPEAFEVMRESEREVHEQLMKKVDELYTEDESIKL